MTNPSMQESIDGRMKPTADLSLDKYCPSVTISLLCLNIGIFITGHKSTTSISYAYIWPICRVVTGIFVTKDIKMRYCILYHQKCYVIKSLFTTTEANYSIKVCRWGIKVCLTGSEAEGQGPLSNNVIHHLATCLAWETNTPTNFNSVK